MTGVASFILLTDVGDQRGGPLDLNLQGSYQRIFRVNDEVSRFPLKFEANRKLHPVPSRFLHWKANTTTRRGARTSCRRQRSQPLQCRLADPPSVKAPRLGKPTVQNDRKPDHQLKYDFRPFVAQAVQYFATVPLPLAVQVGQEFLRQPSM
jgi:hypothetical protein